MIILTSNKETEKTQILTHNEEKIVTYRQIWKESIFQWSFWIYRDCSWTL